jgi:hypothetical protein
MAEDNSTRSSQPDSLTKLNQQRQELVERRQRVQRLYYTFMGGSAIILIALPVWLWTSHVRISSVLALAILYGLTPVALLPSLRVRVRDVETELQDTDFRIDLLSYEVNKRETRAEKILRLNEIQLRRYYDLNLGQNRWVFALGMMCIILGVTIIGVTLYLVIHVATNDKVQIITAVLGGVGALLTNFVAAIYLKMNTSATENLAAFHSRLVETYQLLFGNLLASRIEDDTKRWDTLAALSLRVTDPRADPTVKK